MIPRIHLAHLPTPIEPLPRLSAFLQGPDIYIKRDDQTGLALGGNKTRKLEFLMAEALSQGAKTLLSAGAVQSNHCRQVAAAAARFGLGCTLVLFGDPPQYAEGNYLLDQLLGAEVVFITRDQRDSRLQAAFEEALAAGRQPYLIPYGGSNVTGALAYAFAFDEMLSQDHNPDWIVFASSSGGTQAGLVVGAKQNHFKGKVLGISVDSSSEALKALVSSLAEQASYKLGIPCKFAPDDILVNANYTGAGYGIMGQPEVEAIQLFAKLEGILLDPVYTGRAAAGMLDLISKGFFKSGEKILFWHTGGTPALFSSQYSQQLTGQS